MITNFEEETKELTQSELEMSKIIAQCFNKNHVGKSNAITNREICSAMNNFDNNCNMSDARLRKIINYIRRTKMCKNLIATSKGYYISVDKDEIDSYIKSLHERVSAIQEVIDSFN